MIPLSVSVILSCSVLLVVTYQPYREAIDNRLEAALLAFALLNFLCGTLLGLRREVWRSPETETAMQVCSIAISLGLIAVMLARTCGRCRARCRCESEQKLPVSRGVALAPQIVDDDD